MSSTSHKNVIIRFFRAILFANRFHIGFGEHVLVSQYSACDNKLLFELAQSNCLFTPESRSNADQKRAQILFEALLSIQHVAESSRSIKLDRFSP